LADNIIGIVSGIEKNTPTEFYVNLFSEDGKSIRVRIGDVVRVSVFYNDQKLFTMVPFTTSLVGGTMMWILDSKRRRFLNR